VPPRHLAAAVVRFVARLRRESLPLTPLQTVDAVRALEHVDLADRGEVYLALRAVLVGRPEEQPVFDRWFDLFWRAAAAPPGDPAFPGPSLPDDALPALESQGAPRERLALEGWGEAEEDEGGEPLGVPAASDREAIAAQDFATFSPDQLDEVYRLTVLIARRLARRISRRRRPARRRGRLDLRRTLRANLTRGEMIDLRYRRRKKRKVRLVLLCDVSGSMDLYSRFLLQFLYALHHVFAQVETFTF
jgi:hypothetical protein